MNIITLCLCVQGCHVVKLLVVACWIARCLLQQQSRAKRACQLKKPAVDGMLQELYVFDMLCEPQTRSAGRC